MTSPRDRANYGRRPANTPSPNVKPQPNLTAAPPSSPPKPQARKGPPPPVSTETVTCSCGHTTIFPIYPEKQDRFRQQRREKAEKGVCPECKRVITEANILKQKAEQEAAVERRKGKSKQGRFSVERLPDKSRFAVQYDAATMTWSGELIVPTPEDPTLGDVFAGNATAVFRLLSVLDRTFRKHLAEKANTVPPVTEAVVEKA